MANGKVLTALRQFCLECQGASPKAVRACPDAHCAIWAWRTVALPNGDVPPGFAAASPESLTRGGLRAARRYCLGCAGNKRDVRACTARETCPLWHWRFGVLPRTYRAVRKRFFAPQLLRLF